MRRVEGFTLVEVLVALVAGSLLLVALGWSVGSLGRELRVSNEMEATTHLSKMAPVLTRSIEQAIPVSSPKDFVAEARRLSIVTAPPGSLGATGPVRATFRVVERDGAAELRAAFVPTKATRFPRELAADRLLVGGFKAIRFEYLSPRDEAGANLPRLVTIHFTEPDGQTMSLSAAPRTNSSGNCRFDPISMTCTL